MEKLRPAVRWMVALGFVGIGIAHFTHAHLFVHLMPSYLPMHREAVLVSGFFEVLGGVGLLIPKVRRAAGIGLLALLASVYIVNIEMALHPKPMLDGTMLPSWAVWARLPFQFVFAAAVWWASGQGPTRDGKNTLNRPASSISPEDSST